MRGSPTPHSGGPKVSCDEPYAYNRPGNRTNPPSGSNQMVYNKADQLTSWPGMRQYTYYPDGSLEHVTNAGGTSTLASYTYTPDGLLSQATFNGRTLTNTWDASQQRVGMTANNTDYEFVYDVTAGIPAVVEELKDGTPDVIVRYFREPGGSLISRVQGATAHYYHFDALGSTRLLTTGVGENVVVTDKYAYDAYGALISHDRTANSVDQPYQYVGQLGYYTHWMEPEFGLLQLGVRFYDPEVGRFTQIDQNTVDKVSAYAYSDARPLVLADPSGYTCHEVNPSHSTNIIGKCLNEAKKCLPKNILTGVKRAMSHINGYYQCDDPIKNPDVPPAGETHCLFGTCRINIYKNRFNDCHTVLHELLHVLWWPKYGGMGDSHPEHDSLNNAAQSAWDYNCGDCKNVKRRPSDYNDLIDKWWKPNPWKR